MSNITYSQYWAEVSSLAETIVAESLADHDGDRDAADEDIWDSRLHETIDGHQWVIYNAYNLDILQYSDNAEYMADNFGGDALAESVKNGVSTLHCHMAFWALYADVSDRIHDELNEAAA